jgi:hypothetical protein
MYKTSFHVTIALATHNWTLAGVLRHQSNQLWMSVVPTRQAIYRDVGGHSGTTTATQQQLLQQQIDDAIQLLRDNITVESIQKQLQETYKCQNQRAAVGR